jgi:hypothetical protein
VKSLPTRAPLKPVATTVELARRMLGEKERTAIARWMAKMIRRHLDGAEVGDKWQRQEPPCSSFDWRNSTSGTAPCG